MKKTVIAATVLACCVYGTSVLAASFYFEANGVAGTAAVSGYANAAGTAITGAPPEWSYQVTGGTLNTNLGSFVPGEYTVDFVLDDFWVDYNNDGTHDFTSIIPSTISYSNLGPVTIPFIPPLVGNFGPMTWNIASDLSHGTFVYDFGTTGTFTNVNVDTALLALDVGYGGAPFNRMDAAFGWEHLRVDFNSTAPVPEPMTMLLFGTGLAGLATVQRKRMKKEE